MNAVSQDIFQELDFFAASFLLGMLLVLVYDCLRIFRQIVRHGTAWVSVEDLCYWIGSAFAVFAMLYRKNDGLIRGFAIGGVAAVRYIVLILKKICKVLSWPLKKAYRAAAPAGAFLRGRGKKFMKYLKKRLKKLKNEIKMGISK